MAATAMMLVSVPPSAHAEQAVLVPGATVFKALNPLYPILAQTYPVIGINFHDDATPEVVQYSQNALDADKAILDGVQQTRLVLDRTDGDVVVIGESMGSMVVSRVARELAADPEPRSNIRFVLIAPPEAGVAEYFKEGTYIPILNYRISRVPQSSYPTTVVIGEYDGWADPPDRPWNLLALTNAVFGMGLVHGPPIAAANPATVPAENITVDGNVTTYLVPTEDLPLTQPLRLVGVPDAVMDQVDGVLRPIIDSAYLRHDAPGDTRPYLHDGAIQRNTQQPNTLQKLRSTLRENVGVPVERMQPRQTGPSGPLRKGLDRLAKRMDEVKAVVAERTQRLKPQSAAVD